MTNIPREKIDVPNKRQISSDSMTEKLKGFTRLTLQSTIRVSVDSHSEKSDAESDPKSNQAVDNHTRDRKKRKFPATDTTKVNSPHKLLTNQNIPAIIPFIIPLVN